MIFSKDLFCTKIVSGFFLGDLKKNPEGGFSPYNFAPLLQWVVWVVLGRSGSSWSFFGMPKLLQIETIAQLVSYIVVNCLMSIVSCLGSTSIFDCQ